jgi:hypothetical protein
MALDVSLSGVLAILTLVMGYLGVHLTMHPAESPTARSCYKGGFGTCAILMVGLVVWQALRNGQNQASLQAQVTDLQQRLAHSHIHFDTNPVISVGNPTKFKVPTTLKEVFIANGRAEFNVYYQNVGASNVKRTAALGNVIVTEARPDLDQAFSKLSRQFGDGWKGDELVPQDRRFVSPNSRNLTVDEINRLDDGKLGLFLVAAVRFSDSTGEYQQEFCGWLQLPARELVWHGCGTHDSEIKLTNKHP